MLYLKNETYRDEDLTFSVKVYDKDLELGKWCLGNVRRLYPRSRIIIVVNGSYDIKPSDFDGIRAEFYSGDDLYYLESGGKMLGRMIDLFLWQPTEYLFKIDTDTGFHRRFKWLPRGYGIFGQLQHDNYLCSIQGGFIGMHYDVARTIAMSGTCQHESLKDCGATYAKSPFVLDYCLRRGKISEDWLTGYVCAKLGIPIFGFEEVKSNWKEYIPNPELTYAVTHPTKDFHL